MKFWRKDRARERFSDACTRVIAVMISWTPPEGVRLMIEVHPAEKTIQFTMHACCCVTGAGVKFNGGGNSTFMHAALDDVARNLIAARDARHAADEGRETARSGETTECST